MQQIIYPNRKPGQCGITRRAKLLGVCPSYLSAIVHGSKTSTKLLARYEALIAEERAADPLWPAKELVESTLVKAEEIMARMNAACAAKDEAGAAIIGNELADTITPEFIAAYRAVQMRDLTARNILRVCNAFGCFAEIIFDINRVPGTNRILIGAPQAGPSPTV